MRYEKQGLKNTRTNRRGYLGGDMAEIWLVKEMHLGPLVLKDITELTVPWVSKGESKELESGF